MDASQGSAVASRSRLGHGHGGSDQESESARAARRLTEVREGLARFHDRLEAIADRVFGVDPKPTSREANGGTPQVTLLGTLREAHCQIDWIEETMTRISVQITRLDGV